MSVESACTWALCETLIDTKPAWAYDAPALASARVSWSTAESGDTSATTTTEWCSKAFASGAGTPPTTAGRRFDAFAFVAAAAFAFALAATLGGASATLAFAFACGCNGLIEWTACAAEETA